MYSYLHKIFILAKSGCYTDAPQSRSSTSGLAMATALAHLSNGRRGNPATTAAPCHELPLPCLVWRMGHQPKWLGQLEMDQPVLACRNSNPCQFTLDLLESIQIGSNLQNFIAIQINSIKM
jgi:hypothetical protein